MKISDILCGVFFVESLSNSVNVSQLPKRTVSKTRQALSTNTKLFSQAHSAIIGALV